MCVIHTYIYIYSICFNWNFFKYCCHNQVVESMIYMGRRVRTGVQVGLTFHCSSNICQHQLALQHMPQLYETHLSCLAKRRRIPQTLSITIPLLVLH